MLLLLLLSCFQQPASVQTFEVSDLGCGRWEVAVGLSARPDAAVELLADGAPVAAWRHERDRSVPPTVGAKAPGVEVAFEIRVDGVSVESQVLSLGRLRDSDLFIAVAPDVAPGNQGLFLATEAPSFRIDADVGACAGGSISWTARLDDGRLVIERELLQTEPFTVSIPPQAPGAYTLIADVYGWWGPAVTRTSRIEVLTTFDADGDGAILDRAGGDDCDDADRRVPGDESTTPNGKDDDCDGVVDEGTVAYDDDGDGYSENDGDCDDADPTRSPLAVEAPDCLDQDCDGEVDEGLTRPQVDDVFEPNDERGAPAAISGLAQLAVVTRDKGDAEWFSFELERIYRKRVDPGLGRFLVRTFLDSDYGDGGEKSWDLVVTGEQIPTGGAYDVVFRGRDGEARGAVSKTGDRVELSSRGGSFLVGLVPKKSPGDWCPASFDIGSR